MDIDKVVNAICIGMVAELILCIATDAWFGVHDDGSHAGFTPRY